MDTHEPNPLLTTAEVARMLGVAEATVRRMSRDGTLPWLAVGTGPRPMRRYPRTDIETFIQGRVKAAW